MAYMVYNDVWSPSFFFLSFPTKGSGVACSVVCSGTDGHGPVIFGYAAPENPDHDDREEREEGFEQRTVDFAVRCLAKMSADDKVEDLSNDEEQGSRTEVYYNQ